MCLEHSLGLHVLTSMHVRASCVIGLGVHVCSYGLCVAMSVYMFLCSKYSCSKFSDVSSSAKLTPVVYLNALFLQDSQSVSKPI